MSDQVAIVIALIGLVGLALAAMAGLGGAILGSRIAANATTRAAATAQATAGSDREEARRTRFGDRKLELAVDLLLAADRHRRDAGQHIATRLDRWEADLEVGPLEWTDPLPDIGSSEPVRTAYLALDIVAPGSAAAAAAFYEATVPLGSLAASWQGPDRVDDYKKWARDWTEATERWDDVRRDFVDAVRTDIGVTIDAAS